MLGYGNLSNVTRANDNITNSDNSQHQLLCNNTNPNRSNIIHYVFAEDYLLLFVSYFCFKYIK